MNRLIPDIPHIIIVLVNLKDQWEQEIKCHLKPASIGEGMVLMGVVFPN